VAAFRVKLGANDLNCVDVPLNRTHSLTHSLRNDGGDGHTRTVFIMLDFT